MINCAFTGHRRLNGELDVLLLERVILNLAKNGVKNFYCGMAQGFDLAAAECVLNVKNQCAVSLFACIPCENQTEKYSAADKRRYEKIIERCDGEIILSKEYFSGCMYRRDRFLVDNCDVLVSFLRKKSGGTFYTVNYARRLDKKIIEL